MLPIISAFEYAGDNVVFGIKPLVCTIGKPFCVVRQNLEQGTNKCQFFGGIRRIRCGISYVKCNYDEEEIIRSKASNIPVRCSQCTNYYGDICISYGDFREPCSDFIEGSDFVKYHILKILGEK